MPSRPARMRIMGIATTTRGTTLGALSQMMAQVSALTYVCCVECEWIFASIQLPWGHSRQVLGSGMKVQRWISVTLILCTSEMGAGGLLWGELVGAVTPQRHRSTHLYLFSCQNPVTAWKGVFYKLCYDKISQCLVHPPENYLKSDVLLFILILFFMVILLKPCYTNELKAILLPSMFELNVFSGWFWKHPTASAHFPALENWCSGFCFTYAQYWDTGELRFCSVRMGQSQSLTVSSQGCGGQAGLFDDFVVFFYRAVLQRCKVKLFFHDYWVFT